MSLAGKAAAAQEGRDRVSAGAPRAAETRRSRRVNSFILQSFVPKEWRNRKGRSTCHQILLPFLEKDLLARDESGSFLRGFGPHHDVIFLRPSHDFAICKSFGERNRENVLHCLRSAGRSGDGTVDRNLIEFGFTQTRRVGNSRKAAVRFERGKNAKLS